MKEHNHGTHEKIRKGSHEAFQASVLGSILTDLSWVFQLLKHKLLFLLSLLFSSPPCFFHTLLHILLFTIDNVCCH